jgi:DNA polymerase III sliding clamp (beta) subunit (PCNA family)
MLEALKFKGTRVLEALKFVQRGVARRELIPGLTHFRIVDGRVTGFNGSYSLSAPVDIGFNVAPAANIFIKALDACEDVITLKMDGKNLLVRSGNFRTLVPCLDLNTVPITEPEGRMVPSHESILSALDTLKPFVGIDASRPWSTGILFTKQSAYATNNIIIAEYWLGSPFPGVVNVPSAIVDEVCKVSEELSVLQISDTSITFHYADGRWIKSALLNLDWPNIMTIFEQAWEKTGLRPISEGLREACEKLSRFGDPKDSRTYFRGNEISTHKEGSVAGGALIDFPGAPDKGCYHTGYLNDLLEIADVVDFTKYPAPIPFGGNRLRGAMVGISV